MIHGKKVIGVIPARGGSKGILHKNIVDLGGKPLLAYTIEAALGCEYIDRLVVSTDDKEIARTAQEYGADVPFMRPGYLAGDTAKTIDVLLHALERCEEQDGKYDIAVLLQATSPFRDARDIAGALEMHEQSGGKSLLSVSEADSHPLLIRSRSQSGSLTPVLKSSSTVRRQDMEKYYVVNGAIYVNGRKHLGVGTSLNDNELGYVISRKHGIDIDEEEDLVLAECMIHCIND